MAAKKFDLNYIGLDGDVACMVNGAGKHSFPLTVDFSAREKESKVRTCCRVVRFSSRSSAAHHDAMCASLTLFLYFFV